MVRENVATWLCRDSGFRAKGWRLVTTSPGIDNVTNDLDFELKHDWLRLGLGQSNLVIVAPDRIYRQQGTQWPVIYQAESQTRQYPKFDQDETDTEDEYFFPQRSATPVEYGDFFYFLVEDDGNTTDLYRLQFSLENEDLEAASSFLAYRFVGNYVFHISDIYVENDLWIANHEYTGSVYQINNHGDIYMASLHNNVIFDGKIQDIKIPENWKMRLPVGAISSRDGDLFLAGTDGIVKVTDSLIQPIVYFVYPKGMSRTPYTSRPQYDYHIRPQRLAILSDGSFIIGDSYDGIYIVRNEGNSYSIGFPEISEKPRNINSINE
ncbi:MAG: hypothetical protein F6J87_29235 [Spirulina sp. SIO3F2]|nr:hypothetical protein [Spirulina sp. SIO3F2]